MGDILFHKFQAIMTLGLNEWAIGIHACWYLDKFILVWPTSWTPAVGGLIVCVCVCVSLCVRRHVTILLGAC